jgi:hypothetical protein
MKGLCGSLTPALLHIGNLLRSRGKAFRPRIKALERGVTTALQSSSSSFLACHLFTAKAISSRRWRLLFAGLPCPIFPVAPPPTLSAVVPPLLAIVMSTQYFQTWLRNTLHANAADWLGVRKRTTAAGRVGGGFEDSMHTYYIPNGLAEPFHSLVSPVEASPPRHSFIRYSIAINTSHSRSVATSPCHVQPTFRNHKTTMFQCLKISSFTLCVLRVGDASVKEGHLWGVFQGHRWAAGVLLHQQYVYTLTLDTRNPPPFVVSLSRRQGIPLPPSAPTHFPPSLPLLSMLSPIPC